MHHAVDVAKTFASGRDSITHGVGVGYIGFYQHHLRPKLFEFSHTEQTLGYSIVVRNTGKILIPGGPGRKRAATGQHQPRVIVLCQVSRYRETDAAEAARDEIGAAFTKR